MRALVVSPHFDDAVLSLGQWLTAHRGSVVATVCSAIPRTDNPLLTSYDANCGFTNAVEAVTARRVEDQHALSVIRAGGIGLGFVDGAYLSRDGHFVLDVAQAIRRTFERFGPFDLVLGPLGLSHPDHIATGAAVRRFAQANAVVGVGLYEELPYRVLQPEVVPEALRIAEEALGPLRLAGPVHASLRRKRAAIRAYESQLWALNRRCCYVPERIWERVTE